VGLLRTYVSVCLLFLNMHGLDAAVLLVLILLAYTAVVLTFLLVLGYSFLANYFTSCTYLSLSHPHHRGVFHNLDQQS
jgi:hypothetical protein